MAYSADETWIGIQLGYTNSRVVYYRTNGEVIQVRNKQGNLSTPSFVAFTNTDILIGEEAKQQANLNPSNTIFGIKSLLGRPYEVTDAYWPFKVVNVDGWPQIQVDYKGETKTFTPKDIYTHLLMKMKEIAEAQLGHKVSKAVITLPVWPGDAQHELKIAAAISGFKNVRFLSEPEATVFFYGYCIQKQITKPLNVLIFHLSGGTFDVSIATVAGAQHTLHSTSAVRTAGEKFVSRMVNYFIEDFKQKHNKDLSPHARALCRLRTACEKAKRVLSTSLEAPINLDFLYEGIDFYTTISRARFEELCDDLFRDFIPEVNAVLFNSNFDKNSIDEIILVGGSTRIPKIQQLLKDFFGNGIPFRIFRHDACVVAGAAIVGGLNRPHY